MASILDRIKTATIAESKKKLQQPLSLRNAPGIGGLVSGVNIAAQATKPQPRVSGIATPTSFSAVNAITGASRPQSPGEVAAANQAAQQTAQRTQTATPTARATAQPTQPTTAITPPATGRTFGASSASEFKSLYGRDPKGQELMDFVAGTYRPPTPPPEMVRDATKADTGEVTDLSLATKLLKLQYGDQLSDSELQYLAQKTLDQGKTDLTATEQALADLEARYTKQSEAALQLKLDEEERLAQRREEQLAKYETALRAQAQADIEEAQRVGRETQTTEERLLGARGNLTSVVGANRLQDIQRQTSNAINAVNARVNAQLAMEQAQLEGADEDTMKGLADRYSAALDRENAAQLESERILQEAKLEAQQAGNEAFMELIQNAIDKASLDKVASQIDPDVSEFINDGFVYDKSGQKVKDAEGKFMTYNSKEELDEFMNVGGNLFNKTTGKFIMSPAGTPQEQKAETAARVQMVRDAELNKRLVDELIADPNLPRIVGAGVLNPINLLPGSPGQETIAKLNQIIDKLTVDERGKLKGQGTITDFETRLLANAATPLKRSLSDKAAIAALQELSNKFQSVITADYLEAKAGIDKETAYDIIDEYTNESGVTPTVEIIQKLYPPSFNQPAGTGSTTLRDGMRARTPMGNATLTGVERGSDRWQYGLDMVLSGGKGAPVPFPYSGTVLSAQNDGGFGNSVLVQLPNGMVIRTSHLDAMNVQPGQTVRAGQIIGTQGNTGDVYSLSGGDGTHLDITIYDPNGNPYSSQQVAQLLGVIPLA